MNNKLTMQVKVYAPFRTYFEGEAASLSAINRTGPFDVLPQHKSFMTLLIPGVLTIRLPGKTDFKMKVDHGVLHVRANKVTAFLDI